MIKKILLITSFFPPDQHTGALRWARLGKHLTERGYEFHVVAGGSGVNKIPQTEKAIFVPASIRRIDYKRYHSLHALLVPIFGSKKAAKPYLPARSDSVSNKRIFNNLLVFFKLILKRFVLWAINLVDYPHPLIRWVPEASKAAVEVIRSKGIDIIIATHPFMGCLQAAFRASRETGVPWIADMRDPWAADPQSPYLKSSILSNRLKRYEYNTLRTASRVVTINEQLAGLLAVEKNQLSIIPNSFDPGEYQVRDNYCDQTKKKVINIVYAGTVQSALLYHIFFDGLRRVQMERGVCRLQIHYYGSTFKQMASYAERVGINKNVLYNHGVVSYDTALEVMNCADLLLVFGWQGPSAECVVTGKIFDYLGVGKPVIAVVPPGQALAALVNETGCGKVLSTAEQVASFLQELIISPQAALQRLIDQRNDLAIEKYTTPYTAGLYDEVIKSVVGQSMEGNNQVDKRG